jgi:hypothetical protein
MVQQTRTILLTNLIKLAPLAYKLYPDYSAETAQSYFLKKVKEVDYRKISEAEAGQVNGLLKQVRQEYLKGNYLEFLKMNPYINKGELAKILWPGRKEDTLYSSFSNKLNGVQGRKFTDQEEGVLKKTLSNLFTGIANLPEPAPDLAIKSTSELRGILEGELAINPDIFKKK